MDNGRCGMMLNFKIVLCKLEVLHKANVINTILYTTVDLRQFFMILIVFNPHDFNIHPNIT